MIIRTSLLIASLMLNSATGFAQDIIDVHRHAGWPDGDAESVRTQTLATMKQNGIGTAVVSINDYDQLVVWNAESGPNLVLAAYVGCPRNLSEPRYKCFPVDEGWVDLEWLRAAIRNGSIKALHEIGPNYLGISIGNPRFEPYLALAADEGIPVGIHTGRGPPPGSVNSTRGDPHCCPNYDGEMGNPSLLRPVLEKHPDLKVWLQHVGAGRDGGFEPFWDETLSLLNDYPNIYVDLSITNGPAPIEQYEAALRRLISAGFGDRIMFGSDNIPYELILKRINSFQWMTPAQRRAILHGNAERFFGLATTAED